MAKLSIQIPSIGRPSLASLLRALQRQLHPDDCVQVIGDGPRPQAEAQVTALGDPRVEYLEYPDGPANDWGCSVRNWSMPRARGTHLFFIDDDDVLCPGALDCIRQRLAQAPDKILLFRMEHDDEVVWRTPEIYLGNISTQMVVVPNDPARLGTWSSRYGCDCDFVQRCVDLHPEGLQGVLWCEEILSAHGIGGRAPQRRRA